MKYYKPFLVVAIIIIIALFAYPRVVAKAAQEGLPEAPQAPLKQVIAQYASYYGVDGEALYKTLYCESRLNPSAIGALGEVGIAQIYLKYHPTVTREQALDPIFSIKFAAQEFSKGNATLWSCYRIYSSSL